MRVVYVQAVVLGSFVDTRNNMSVTVQDLFPR